MTDSALTFSISRQEAQQLADLVAQFSQLLEPPTAEGFAGATSSPDPALLRLTPSAYPHDVAAAADFREATRDDLLERRQHDALAVLADLAPSFAAAEPRAGSSPIDPADDTIDVVLGGDTRWAWMRTLTAIRLVIATRLGIAESDERHGALDDRFAVYDWVGFRLDQIVHACAAHG